MSAQGVRIVVGEGRSSRQGLLRFVLSEEGYDVVADASNPAELARVLAVHKPDVVVLDDGIGATTVGMVREMLPSARMILVWPEAVSPIGGAAQVEPSQVLQDLGPAVERLTGVAGTGTAGEGPAAVDRAKRDPGALRRMLRTAGVVDLASRSRTNHPTADPSDVAAAAAAEPIIDDREPAPVVILPVTPSVDDDAGVVHVPDAGGDASDDGADEDDGHRKGAAALAAGTAGVAAMLAGGGSAAAAEGSAETAVAGTAGHVAAAGSGAAAASAPSEAAAAGGTASAGVAAASGAQSVLNRRLGNVALAGAAVAGALVFALALGGARVPIAGVNGETITISLPDPNGPGSGGNPPGTNPDGDGNGGGPDRNGDGNGEGDEAVNPGAFYPIQPFAAAAIPFTAVFPKNDGPPVRSPSPSNDENPGGRHRSHHQGSNGPGPKHHHAGDDRGPSHRGTKPQHKSKHADRTPGHSGEHNPHGGPPGLSGNGHGQGGEHSNAGGNDHGQANGHGHGHGQGNGHGHGQGHGHRS